MTGASVPVDGGCLASLPGPDVLTEAEFGTYWQTTAGGSRAAVRGREHAQARRVRMRSVRRAIALVTGGASGIGHAVAAARRARARRS